MMKFGNPRPTPGVLKQRGKGGAAAMLPNRAALNRLVKTDPLERTVSQYAAAMPTGQNAPLSYPSIMGMAKKSVI
jgi:hypothetical protein